MKNSLRVIIVLITFFFAINIYAKEQFYSVAEGNISAVPNGMLEANISYGATDTQDVYGLAFRIHYKSTDITGIEANNYFPQGHLGISNPVDDINNLDNNLSTDRFIVAAWFDPVNPLVVQNGQVLISLKLDLSEDNSDFTDLIISPISSPGYKAKSTSVIMDGTYSIGDLVKDNDDLDDTWEILYFNNLNALPGEDNDNDGLTNIEEYQLGTNPTQEDSDDDGVFDSIDDYPLDSEKSEDTRIALNIYAPESVYDIAIGEPVTIPVMYQAVDDSQIEALSFKLYFNSQLLQWSQTTNLISTGLLGRMDAVYDDMDNRDNDTLTDSYLQVTWFDSSNNWPGVIGESKLFDIEFSLLQDLGEDATALNVVGDEAGISTGYKVVAEPINVAMSFNSFTLDINGDGKVSLPIDGFIILRSMVGFPASALASDEDMVEASRTRDEMVVLLNNAKESSLLDINGDGKVSLPIDGFIILRHMVGFPASSLASDEDMADATRTKEEMKSYMESFSNSL
jgi:hypothetical protein